ncbi:hypothetical protein RB599_010090 [Gaeumannomyces hyphopodioides]
MSGKLPPRPASTGALVDRFHHASTPPDERKILIALASKMAEKTEQQYSSYQGWATEAAALLPIFADSGPRNPSHLPSSSVEDSPKDSDPPLLTPAADDRVAQEIRIEQDKSYKILVRAFSNAVSMSQVKDPIVYETFVRVLRSAPASVMLDTNVGPVVKGLQFAINDTNERPSPNVRTEQYRLLSALASTLDTMLDMKPQLDYTEFRKLGTGVHNPKAAGGGMDRESAYEPLHKLLSKLKDEPEIRLAEVATRAHMALLLIGNGESPFEKFCRHSGTALQFLTKVSGGVTTLDIDKIYSGVSAVEWLELVKGMVSTAKIAGEAAKAFQEAYATAEPAFESAKNWLTARSMWYIDLRFTEVLVRKSMWDDLKTYLEEVERCRRSEHFLCGLYSQLEQAWFVAANCEAKDHLRQFVNGQLDPLTVASRHERVGEWMKAVALTMGREEEAKAILDRARVEDIKAAPPRYPLLDNAKSTTYEATTAAPEGKRRCEISAALQPVFNFFRNMIKPNMTPQPNDTSASQDTLQIPPRPAISGLRDDRGQLRPQPEKPRFQTEVACLRPRQLPESSNSLCTAAWKECTPAHRFYADRGLTNYYLESDRLKMQLLSGQYVSMDYCYINLGVVKKGATPLRADPEPDSESEGGWDPGSGLDLYSDSTIDVLPLRDIFSKPQLQTGATPPQHPNRILIRGKAGMGKTTLAKKMLSNFIHRLSDAEPWRDRFDRILWIPLRELNNKDLGVTRKKWLEHNIFRRQPDADLLAEACDRACNDSDGRTLFILDGLDEVDMLLREDPVPHLMEDFLRSPNVIITSRPGTALDKGFGRIDLELEAAGFTPEQVNLYIEGRAELIELEGSLSENRKLSLRQQMVKDTKNHIASSDLVDRLVTIPIQLEALCYSWKAEPGALCGGVAKVVTITRLYTSVAEKLWRKDAQRLHSKPLKEANEMLPSVLYRLMQPNVDQISCMAWLGFQASVSVFRKAQLDWLSTYHHVLAGEKPYWDQSLLNNTSFLRRGPDNANMAYHFAHLTYQEYFAAVYFVKHWIAGTELQCLQPGEAKGPSRFDKSPERMAPEDLLRQMADWNKWRADNVFWRFVAGLLGDEKDKKHVARFSKLLWETVGKSLHGYGLIVLCLHEVRPRSGRTGAAIAVEYGTRHAHGDSDDLGQSRWLMIEKAIEDSLTHRVDNFGSSIHDNALVVRCLVRMPEFPPHLLHRLVRLGMSKQVDINGRPPDLTSLRLALHSLASANRTRGIPLPDELLSRLARWMDNASSARCFREGRYRLPDEIRQRLPSIDAQSCDDNLAA